MYELTKKYDYSELLQAVGELALAGCSMPAPKRQTIRRRTALIGGGATLFALGLGEDERTAFWLGLAATFGTALAMR